ncbi:MAG: hypothetical protein ACM3ZB_08560 [bacterium]|jgi:hypothetical protein
MRAVLLAAGVLLAGAMAQGAELRKATLALFEDYVRKTEARLDGTLKGGSFLWVDTRPDALEEVRTGGVAIRPMTGKGEKEIRGGLVHDWMGAVFIPGAKIGDVLAVAQDYDHHKYTHKPEVLDSKLISKDGNRYKAFLRVSKHKVITVVLNTDHDVTYYPVDATRWHSRSYSTRIAQVQDPGEASERELPPGRDGGYLWRLYSYWRFEERDGGVYVECEALSLTRDVPAVVSWLVTPIIRELPRESLANTLISTRNAVLARARR